MKKLTVPENIYLEKFDVNVKPYLSYAEIQAISKAVNNFDSWAEREVNLDMLLLHFATDIKDNVLQELSKEFQKEGLGEYTKNDTNIFEKVTSEERLHTAIKNCEYMEELNKDVQASRRNPMTKVYKIIDGLKEYLE